MPDSGLAEAEDPTDRYPMNTPVYSGLPSIRGSKGNLNDKFVGQLTHPQDLIPFPDETGAIQGDSSKGKLVHYIGIKGLKINSGWLPSDKRIIQEPISDE